MINKLKSRNVINNLIIYFFLLPRTEKRFSRLINILSKIKENYIIFLYISGIIIYCISLTHLSGLGMTCFFWEGIYCYYAIGILILISSFIISITIYIIIYKKYKKYHLIIISIFYSFLFIIDHNDGIVKHGLFNFISFMFITFILFIFILLLWLLINLIRKRKFFSFFILSTPFPSLFILLKLYKLSHFSCDNWAQGLNKSFVDNLNKDYPCDIIIPQPHSCYISELGHFFDFVEKYSPNCQDAKLIQIEKKKFLKDLEKIKYFNVSKKTDFGYPLTNNDQYNPNFFGCMVYPGNISFEDYIKENIILLDLYNKNKSLYYNNISKPEIEVHVKNEGGQIIFKIQKNDTLINERAKALNSSKILYKNVLVIFFDTLSRVHFFRKFPKTVSFLNQFSKYEENYLKKNMTIFQYFKYHSIGTYTDPNIKAAYYGAKIDGKGTHFVNYYKKKGYIVGRVNTFCGKEVIFNKKNNSFYEHGIWDHEGLSLGCISTFYDKFLITRLTSVIKKCLFGKELNQYALEYLESFWTTYLEQNKMFLYQTLDSHEPTGEVIGYFDNSFYHFLNKFYKNGYFKDTAIILFSDHGQHLNGPFYLFDSQDFHSELTLPLLLLIIPNYNKLYKDGLYDKIISNQQIFITSYDIYNTLLHIAFGDICPEYKQYSIQYGSSLLMKMNYKRRYCGSPLFDFKYNLCKCEIKKHSL
jgi:hypothetical protein